MNDEQDNDNTERDANEADHVKVSVVGRAEIVEVRDLERPVSVAAWHNAQPGCDSAAIRRCV